MHFFYDNSWITVFACILICFIFAIISTKHSLIALSVISLFVLRITLIRSHVTVDQNVKLFWSYKQFFTNPNLKEQILNNILLFIPFGAGIFAVFRKSKYLIVPFLLSILIESLQYIFILVCVNWMMFLVIQSVGVWDLS